MSIGLPTVTGSQHFGWSLWDDMTIHLKHRVTHFVAAILLAVALALSLASCGEAEPVVIATDGNYHPFNFVNDAGEIDGLEREMGDELWQARRPGVRVGHQRLGVDDPRSGGGGV